MPYTIRKSKCKQSSGKPGSYTLSYTDKKGKKHSNCHTSRKRAQAQIGAIEMREDNDVDPRDPLSEGIMIMVMAAILESQKSNV